MRQNEVNIEVRKADGIHDRYVIVDNRSCYQSGASFKDGAKKVPTTVTQVTDAFEAVNKAYQDIWEVAEVIR